ncbi:hypothetical protein ACIRN4_17845 [Pimelobacter simplex]|uniref:hypothetical protein n=1 Tax=Nocardioides simplex TaxID=2045 RepID=UPI003829161A
MSANSKIALAVAGGYLLGRTKKLRLAMTLAGMLAGKKLATNRQLLAQGAKLVEGNPQFKELQGQLTGRLVEVAREAALVATASRVESLTQSLKGGKGDQGRGDEADDELDDEPDEADDELDDGPDEADDEGYEDEAYDDEESEEPEEPEEPEDEDEPEDEPEDEESPPERRPRKAAAKKAPAKRAPAKKTTAAAKKTAAKKAPAKKTAAKRSTSRRGTAKKSSASSRG